MAITGESPISGPNGLFAWPGKSEISRDVCRFLTRGARLAAIELDARVLAECSLANVLQLTDSLRGRDNINVVKVGKTAAARGAGSRLKETENLLGLQRAVLAEPTARGVGHGNLGLVARPPEAEDELGEPGRGGKAGHLLGVLRQS